MAWQWPEWRCPGCGGLLSAEGEEHLALLCRLHIKEHERQAVTRYVQELYGITQPARQSAEEFDTDFLRAVGIKL